MSGCNKFHDEFQNEENHHIQAFCYTTQADRLAATGYEPCPGDPEKPFDAGDVGKIAKQENTNPSDGEVTFWVLCGIAPVTWDEITNKTVAPVLDVKVSVSSNDTTAGFLEEKLTESLGTNTNSRPLQWRELNDGADEDLDLRFDASKIDHDDLINSGGNKHIDWTSPGVEVIDTSRYDDNKAGVDSTDTPGFLEDKIQAGPNIAINKTGPVGSRVLEIEAVGDLAAADCPAVQVRRTTNYTMTGTWVDLTFDQTDVENDPANIEHNNTQTDRIDIKASGLYVLEYHFSVMSSGAGEACARLRVNDTTVIPGSEICNEDSNDANLLSNKVFYQFQDGDFLSLQTQFTSGAHEIVNDTIFTVFKCAGAKGDQGDTGAGSSINLETDNSSVPGGPHDTLNFDDNFVVTNNGSGKATVSFNPSVFGSEYTEAEDLSESSTTSSTPQLKVRLTTGNIPAGRYRLGYSYGWRHSSTGSDFDAQIVEDLSTQIFEHRQEPKDSGGDQRHRVGGFINRTLSAGIHTFDLNWSENNGSTAHIRDARLEFWRLT
jgi:hypothetical protein